MALIEPGVSLLLVVLLVPYLPPIPVHPTSNYLAVKSGTVLQARDAFLLGAVSAAEKRAVLLDPVTDHFAAAVGTGRCQGVDGALEAVEGVRLARHRDGDALS